MTDDSPGSQSPAPPVGPVTVGIRATSLVRAVLVTCIVIEVALVLADYHVNYGRLTDIGTLGRLTNITREDSLASWFGTTQTTLIALTLWWLWTTLPAEASRRRRAGWLVLACFFSFMAVDDGAMLHERAGTLASDLASRDSEATTTPVGARILDRFPSYAWQVVVLPFFVAMGFYTAGFLWRELGSGRQRLVVLAALGCFALAVALDFFEGLDEDHPWNVYTALTQIIDFGDWTEYRFRRSAFDTLVHFSKSLEEFLEMLGNTLLWTVFLRTLTRTASDVRIRFS